LTAEEGFGPFDWYPVNLNGEAVLAWVSPRLQSWRCRGRGPSRGGLSRPVPRHWSTGGTHGCGLLRDRD